MPAKKYAKARPLQTGATMIEVLVTFLILSVGLLGLAGMQTNALKDGLDTSQRSQVIWMIQELAERMRANPTGQYNTAGDPCSQAVKYCADYSTGGSQSAASTTCTPNELADFDVWDVYCGHKVDGVISNTSNTVALSAITIQACPVPGCDAPGVNNAGNFKISLSWTAKSVEAQVKQGELTGPQANATETMTLVVRP